MASVAPEIEPGLVAFPIKPWYKTRIATMVFGCYLSLYLLPPNITNELGT